MILFQKITLHKRYSYKHVPPKNKVNMNLFMNQTTLEVGLELVVYCGTTTYPSFRVPTFTGLAMLIRSS